jgi:hypothetical protein
MKKTGSSQHQSPIQQEILRSLRYHRPLSLMVVGSDPSSPPTLLSSGSKFSEILRRHLRNTDIVTEESDMQALLLLPETPLKGALVVGNRLAEDLLKGGPGSSFDGLAIGISSIEDGVYRAEDLVQTAILSNRAAKATGQPLFTISNFRDKSLSLPTLVAIGLLLPGDDAAHLSSFFERTRREPEGLRQSASKLTVKLAERLKISEEAQEALAFWILFHDIPQYTSDSTEPEQKLPHLSRRKKALHGLILHYLSKEERTKSVDPKSRALLTVVRAVLQEIVSYHNPTEEMFDDLLGKIVSRFESEGMDKKILNIVRKTQPTEWFPYPT